MFFQCYHGKRLRQVKQDPPGPTGCIRVSGRAEAEVQDGSRACGKSPTIWTELRVLLSAGVELPWAKMKKQPRCTFILTA